MGLIDPSGGKAGTLVAAAMESAGVAVQSEILTWMQGDGQMVAGALYMLAVVYGVFTFAVGGQYIWARYLLVGPPLFFFLTQVTQPSTGAHWKFADHEFQDSHVARALKGTGYDATNAKASAFFVLWNNFMSDVTQELIDMLRLTQDGSHLDFMTKFERYMQIWITKRVTSENLSRFVRLIMINECADYYMMLMSLNNPHVDEVEKTEYRRQIANRANEKVFFLNDRYTTNDNEMHAWLREKADMQPGGYTCNQMWEKAVAALQKTTEADISQVLGTNLAVDQTEAQVTAKWLKKMQTETNPANDQVRLQNEAKQVEAMNWVIARTLWNEMATSNKYTEYFNREGHGAYFASNVPYGAFPLQNSTMNTSSAIQQYNTTETYQFKGDFVNAALSLPHFQGIALLLLAATFPFFAMVMVLPSRAGTILMWMGLWAWIKLWDFGFAVVMMIDNILYVMLPRGPGIPAGDINNPGRAMVLLMQIDPSYSSAIYYNIISVCMFAVPLVTGVFVKGAGSGFAGMVRSAWQQHSTRLAGSAVSFARALQGRSYVANQRLGEAEAVAQAVNDILASPQVSKDFKDFLVLSGITDAAGGLAGLSGEWDKKIAGLATGGAATVGKVTEAMRDQKMNSIITAVSAYASLKEYQHSSGPRGWWSSESAVAAKYYSHDTATAYPGMQMFAAQTARQYLNQEGMAGKGTDKAVNFGADMMQWFGGIIGGPSAK